MVKRIIRKIGQKDIALLRQYRIKCLNNKIKRFGALFLAAGGIIVSILLDLPITSVVCFSIIPIALVLVIFSKL